jgi:hypothetical protein
MSVFFIDDLQWLKNNSQPFAVVAEKWKNCTKIRTDQFPQSVIILDYLVP